ncbi:MAG TPA: class I SAM-dependent methyltransferase, partial [Candidatus Acidoferrum sp.]|nr:class I SAM-dependent methyltransferase [Candidatus Acidoferrum sp.]
DTKNATRDLDGIALRAQPFELDGAKVVEIGCGTGKNTEWLASAAEVVALDFSDKMIEIARQRVRSNRVTFLQHDVRQPWPVADRFADLITCDLVLEHIEDIGAVFKHARRAMKPGGTLFVSEFHPFRQLLGRQARFAGGDAEEIKIPAFLHDTSDFVRAGLAEGLQLTQLSEWRDEGADAIVPPRLLTLTFRS